jgi:UDP-N-acetylmuramate-alanine ligase
MSFGIDVRRSPLPTALRLWVDIFEGHSAENIEGAQVIVTSTAVRP